MNVGAYLVSKSPLNSGTALAHLLAMQTGSVVGKTIFAAQMTVCVEEPQVTLIQRPSEHTVATTRPQAWYPAVLDEQNSVAVLLPPNEVFVARSMWRMTVMAAKARQCVVTG